MIVRDFYRSADLHFSATGQLVGTGEKGFGPTDALIHIAEIKASSKRIIFTGDLPLMYYDAALDKISFRKGWMNRRVEIDLPPNADTAAAEQAIWSVFYKPTDQMLPPCTAHEKEIRQQLLVEHVGKPEHVHYPATGLCLPHGERLLNQVGENATVPRALSTPDPAFPPGAPRNKDFHGLVVLGLIVDASGHPSTIFVKKSQSSGFDLSAAQAVSKWKFEPATHDGQPVAVFINVEVNFRYK